jgi:hypothetical protein
VPFLKAGPAAIISHVPPVLLAILDAVKFIEMVCTLTPLGHEYDGGPGMCLAVVILTFIKPSAG